jgi:hypothetical protein
MERIIRIFVEISVIRRSEQFFGDVVSFGRKSANPIWKFADSPIAYNLYPIASPRRPVASASYLLHFLSINRI